MSLKNNKNLFDFDKIRRCEERSDAAIQENGVELPDCVLNNTIIIGTDEAGRGPGAGGVFASAVYFPSLDKKLIKKLSSLNDSKKLSKKVREELFEVIIKNSIHSTVLIEVAEIEEINILNASLKAMKLACENVINEVNLNSQLTAHSSQFTILVDGNKLIKQFEYPQEFVIKGDSKSASIAAASILAKVSRDLYMQELDAKFPQYNWKNNSGYLTKQHLAAIDEFGITSIHRKTFLRKHFEKKNTIQLNLN